MINRKNPRLVSLFLFAALLMSGSGGDSSAATNSSPPSTAAKPIMQGLVDMSYIGFYGHGTLPTFNPGEVAPFADSFTGIVVNVQWDQLQPNGPDPLPDDNQIDQDLAMVTAYNSQHPTAPLQVKPRVYGGFVAPTWAQSIGGSPIVITDIQHSRSGTVGRWWTQAYITAWRQLQRKLAQRYDRNPLIHEVAVTSCASATDEPFVNFDSSGIAEIQAAGYADVAQEDCLLGAVKDYLAWKRTSIDFTFNPFHEFDGGKNQVNNQFTIDVMRKCAAEGAHCLLSNHVLSNPLNPSIAAVYQEMQTLEKILSSHLCRFSEPGGHVSWIGAEPSATR
jgi:hypothetical protein